MGTGGESGDRGGPARRGPGGGGGDQGGLGWFGGCLFVSRARGGLVGVRGCLWVSLIAKQKVAEGHRRRRIAAVGGRGAWQERREALQDAALRDAADRAAERCAGGRGALQGVAKRCGTPRSAAGERWRRVMVRNRIHE